MNFKFARNKILVVGTRDFDDEILLNTTLDGIVNTDLQTEIISGGAKGADKMAKIYSEWKDLDFKEFKADWKNLGKSAGPIRNHQMIDYIKGKPQSSIVVAFWDGQSRGTKHTIDLARRNNLLTIVVYY